jgi:hypothetical protein
MLFTRLAYIVAVLGLALGLFNFTMGLLIASGFIGPYEAALARYFPTKSSSGEVIEMGFYMILFSIALGTLTEISYALRVQPKARIRPDSAPRAATYYRRP